ncbi:hypothetical protein JG687_00009352 [Phytophthora cactorum]|uniref:Uncharacterized protein n=1 Tax=Phytophthora cactorum TaxID=29920 RepID=A0A8T1HRK6_9STRA|nr:hypothetical protein Pcac1_g24775 [Phytophthora cactorum]KAG2811200.1 hypothetical protein PC112_g15719 [Phytophthora cactorum]KAG2812758.1 hypothetical protein PC111_g14681 [Phytophthora cactorum]KAG2851608.1 hypothetical protein PC113_g15764 [Phytophthora cactorum]KAG2890705.1 hypothetical protein PC114_g17334 [Phytophthora cactorum]
MAATNLVRRGLSVATSDANTIVAGLRDDELGSSEDFWGSWENHYAGYLDAQEDNESSSNDTNSASGTGELDSTVGDLDTAAKEVLQKAESVITAALPFSIEHATSLILPLGLVAAAMLVIAVAAVLIGVRRQQLSEPMFGPMELVSDLPDPMTTSAASEAGDDDSDTGSHSHADEADTGATILADVADTILAGEEQEEEKEEEGEDFVVALA